MALSWMAGARDPVVIGMASKLAQMNFGASPWRLMKRALIQAFSKTCPLGMAMLVL